MPDRKPSTSRPATRRSRVGGSALSSRRYRLLWYYSATITALISLAPLIVMTFVNFYQYRSAFADELQYTVSRLTSSSRAFLESFLEERRAALTYVTSSQTYAFLCDTDNLRTVLLDLNRSFGGFVDIGVIDERGNQRSYVGPYELEGKNYAEQDWFHETMVRGVHVSDVFKGYRDVPHFVIAVQARDSESGAAHVLRATIDTDVIDRHLAGLHVKQSSDVFLINHEGVLQTSSRHHGGVLEPSGIAAPPVSPDVEVQEITDKDGVQRLMGYAHVGGSPFIFVAIKQPAHAMEGWLYLQRDILWMLVISIAVIIAVILWQSTYLVSRIRIADQRRDKALHNLEYSNKMASIGRMAAGVAHEINNPLAIIGENAGLLQDIIAMPDQQLERGRLSGIIDAIVRSVDRCSTITHRLLGFAKRLDPMYVRVDIDSLLEEVLSFQGREAEYRNITIDRSVPDDLPTIFSDPGQLQQVFLNLLSNAFAAVEDGGRIGIRAELEDPKTAAITISDNGPGIAPENLERIFEPFFSTKGEYGTGLGLSITFGIVQHLGGTIDVTSEPGEGASFTVRLPVEPGAAS